MIWRYSGSFRRHLERGFNQAQKFLPGCCEEIKLFFQERAKLGEQWLPTLYIQECLRGRYMKFLKLIYRLCVVSEIYKK